MLIGTITTNTQTIVGEIQQVGARGYSAYQLALMDGFVGTYEQWRDSLKGGQGDQGVQGPPVPVAHELGDDPDLAVSQKLLTDSIADMEQSNEAAVTEATHQAGLAEAARDAAFVNADVYPDVAAGLAAVADGEQFQVLSDEGLEYRRYRKDSATVATEVGVGFPAPKQVEGAVQQAENAADRAEAASDAAFVNADVYPDVATGRAAVANGEQFQVVVGDEIVRYRRDSSNAQTEMARYLSANLANSGVRMVYGSDRVNVQGAFIGTNGLPVNFSGYSHTDYLDVFGGVDYLVTAPSVHSLSRHAWYAADGSLISAFIPSSDTVTVTAPANARYARFSVNNSQVPDFSVRTVGPSYDIERLESTLSKIPVDATRTPDNRSEIVLAARDEYPLTPFDPGDMVSNERFNTSARWLLLPRVSGGFIAQTGTISDGIETITDPSGKTYPTTRIEGTLGRINITGRFDLTGVDFVDAYIYVRSDAANLLKSGGRVIIDIGTNQSFANRYAWNAASRFAPSWVGGWRWVRMYMHQAVVIGSPTPSDLGSILFTVEGVGGAPVDVEFGGLRCGTIDRGMVSLYFDDAGASVYTHAFPIMRKYGLVGTLPVIAGSGYTDDADQGAGYMTWSQVKELKNAGWAIVSHSSSNQIVTEMTHGEVQSDLSLARSNLELKGYPLGATAFIAPGGAYDRSSDEAASQILDTVRAGSYSAGQTPMEHIPFSHPRGLRYLSVYGGTHTPTTVKGWLDEIASKKMGSNLAFHYFTDGAGSGTVYNVDDFEEICVHIRQHLRNRTLAIGTMTDLAYS